MTKTFLLVAGATMFLTASAQALTITNRDSTEHRLLISEGGDDKVTHQLVVAADQTLDDLCLEGCRIVLEGGEQANFEGGEVVDIEDGRFVIAE